jgi:hypothetical protein
MSVRNCQLLEINHAGELGPWRPNRLQINQVSWSDPVHLYFSLACRVCRLTVKGAIISVRPLFLWWDEIGRGIVDPEFAELVDELLVNAQPDDTYKGMATWANN